MSDTQHTDTNTDTEEGTRPSSAIAGVVEHDTELPEKCAEVINENSDAELSAWTTPNGTLIVEESDGAGFIDTDHPQEMKILVSAVCAGHRCGAGKVYNKVKGWL